MYVALTVRIAVNLTRHFFTHILVAFYPVSHTPSNPEPAPPDLPTSPPYDCGTTHPAPTTASAETIVLRTMPRTFSGQPFPQCSQSRAPSLASLTCCSVARLYTHHHLASRHACTWAHPAVLEAPCSTVLSLRQSSSVRDGTSSVPSARDDSLAYCASGCATVVLMKRL